MTDSQRRRRAQRANALCRPTAASYAAEVETPPASGAKRYAITVTDPETGEGLTGYARCDVPPTAETRELLGILLAAAISAVSEARQPEAPNPEPPADDPNDYSYSLTA